MPGRPEGRPGRFEGKVVVITGGGAGIGRTLGLRFAAEGATIVVGDRDPDAGDRVVKELKDAGADGLAVTMDIADDEAVEMMAERVVGELGGIDVLVNNAAIHLGHAQLPYTKEALPKWRHVLNVNIIGALACSLACHDAMQARGGGSILNVSSMAAYTGTGAYTVSKLGLNALTTSLAQTWAVDGIRVNGVAPILVDSEAAMARTREPGKEGMKDAMIGGQAIKRLGRMQDVANAGLFLCSDEASFITGQTILVDGGYMKKSW
ncbi:MAG: SDR family oxidoreductase [Acidimicrobiales bacterium]|nr:SDR family oxidoreductase [Acidimicrobiales bacterium]